MALKLVVRNKLRVPVKGSMADENGKQIPFTFVLLCTRLSQTQIVEAQITKDALITDFLKGLINGWEGVLDEAGQELPFNAENLDTVMEEAGLPGVCFQAYMKEVGAVAKN